MFFSNFFKKVWCLRWNKKSAGIRKREEQRKKGESPLLFIRRHSTPFIGRGQNSRPLCAKRVACVSCVSATFFQPVRSGSHLYPAHRNTVRSDHREQVLLTLVGLSLCGTAFPSPLELSITHLAWFVKRFFELFCSVGRFCFTSPNYALGRGCSLLSASWHPYCITL